MLSIAVLGYGTVGSGVVEVLDANRDIISKRAGQDIQVKHVLDLRDFEGDPVQKIITHSFDDIINDDDVKIVVEVMGGVDPAFSYTKQCLEKGKSVVTSNKELVAKHGAELLALAAKNKANYFFEASVGGVIPIIRAMSKAFASDRIFAISGILNGTTNYILSKMSAEGMDFDEVLVEAQDKGYAERNPSADVDGHDSCRKIAILLSLAAGKQVDFGDIYTEGITKITKSDFLFAEKIKCTIKLLASAKVSENGISARVSPALVPGSNPIYGVNDVFNAVFVSGSVIDDVMLYGRGAGKLPTAGAVVADIVEAALHPGKHVDHQWSQEKAILIPHGDSIVKKMIRVVYKDKSAAKEAVVEEFGPTEFLEIPNLPDELAFITAESKESKIDDGITKLKKSLDIKSASGIIFA